MEWEHGLEPEFSGLEKRSCSLTASLCPLPLLGSVCLPAACHSVRCKLFMFTPHWIKNDLAFSWVFLVIDGKRNSSQWMQRREALLLFPLLTSLLFPPLIVSKEICSKFNIMVGWGKGLLVHSYFPPLGHIPVCPYKAHMEHSLIAIVGTRQKDEL